MIRLLGHDPPWIARVGMSAAGVAMVAMPIMWMLDARGWLAGVTVMLMVGGALVALFSWMDLGL